MAVAVVDSVPDAEPGGAAASPARLDDLVVFRQQFYDCLRARADALFELCDAVLCTDGPVTTLVGLSLVAEHRRGHGALYDALGAGRIDPARVRWSLAGMPLPRDRDGRIMLAVDVSNWLRPDAATSPDRLFCHTYGRGKGQAQMIPGWPYSFVAALEPGRSSWTAILDAQRLGPADDLTEVTAAQVRDVIERVGQAGHWRAGDADILVVFDAGYDVTRLAWLLRDLPVQLCWAGCAQTGSCAFRRRLAHRAAPGAQPSTARCSPWPMRPLTPSPQPRPAPTPPATAPRSPPAGPGCIRG
jgi:hypothetical protein